jgi:hypothetical protein
VFRFATLAFSEVFQFLTAVRGGHLNADSLRTSAHDSHTRLTRHGAVNGTPFALRVARGYC